MHCIAGKMANTTKTLIDLEPRCVSKISSHLRLTDIVNLAEALNISNLEQDCKIVENNRNQKYLTFAKALQGIFLKMSGGEWYIDSERHISNMVKTMQCFGNLISSLTVDYCKFSAQECMSIDDAILANCRASLKMIELNFLHKKTLANIIHPFQNVKVVHIYGGFLGKRLSKFHRWFPKLFELDIEQVFLETPHSIEHHFPHLSVLRISNGGIEQLSPEATLITDSNIKIALQLNPQIKSLNLCDDEGGRDDFGICLSQKSVCFVRRKLPNLRHLKLTICHLDYETIHQHQSLLRFDFLTTLTLIVKDWSYLSKIPIGSDRLEKLILEAEFSQLETKHVYEIISTFTKNNNNINCLYINSIHSDYDLYDDYVIKYVNGLWNLDEFNIEFNWKGTSAVDAIIHFLKNCKQLIKFTIHWNDDEDETVADVEVMNQFKQEFNTFAEINLFDATIWDIDFENCWSSSSSISFSKQN